jgi:hypothetical protein
MRTIERMWWWPLCLLLPLAAVYWTYLAAPAPATLHDDGIYSVTARSLAAGRGYLIESLPRPIPQTKYPILFPALLAPIHWLGSSPARIEFASRLLALAGALLVAWLAFHAAQRLGLPRPLAVWIPVLWLASPNVVFQATSILPDTLCAAAILGALLLLDASASRPAPPLRLLAFAGLLAASAFLLRSAAIAILLVGLAVLLRRGPRALLAFTLPAACLILPWLLWQSAQPGVADPVLQYYTRQSYGETNIFAAPSLSAAASTVLRNLMPHTNGPLYLQGISSPFTWPLSIAIWLAAAGAALRLLRSPHAAFGLFWLVYSAVILAWAWPQARYLTPLLPLYWILPATLLPAWRPSRPVRGLLLTLAAAGLAWSAWTLGGLTMETRRQGWPAPASDSWPHTLEALQWLRDHTPADAIVAANLDPQVYQVAGRRSIRLFKTDPFLLYYGRPEPAASIGGPARLAGLLRGHSVDYVLLTPMNGFRERDAVRECIRQLNARSPGALQPARVSPHPDFEILRVRRDLLP